MAKVRAGAGVQLSGEIGGIVFCRRAGGVYARAHVVPRDPKTPEQVLRRNQFRAAVEAWRALPNPEKEAWRKRAARCERTGYHLYISTFIERQR